MKREIDNKMKDKLLKQILENQLQILKAIEFKNYVIPIRFRRETEGMLKELEEYYDI